MDLALVQCPNCVKVFQYYDYLSHQEICRNYENYNTLSDIEADDENEQDLENPARKHYEQDLENPTRTHYEQDLENPTRKHYQQDLENPNINPIYYSNNYNNNYNNNGTSSFELFNPMFNRGFINHRYSNIDTNMDINQSDNSLENLLTNIENLDIGLGRDNLEQYGCKLNITEVIECAICLNNYDVGSEFYLMKCLHSFCKICAEVWFESRSFCPLCKTNLKL